MGLAQDVIADTQWLCFVGVVQEGPYRERYPCIGVGEDFVIDRTDISTAVREYQLA